MFKAKPHKLLNFSFEQVTVFLFFISKTKVCLVKARKGSICFRILIDRKYKASEIFYCENVERFLLSSDAEIELKILLSTFLVFSDQESKRCSNNDSESQPPHCAFTNAHFLQENLELVFSKTMRIKSGVSRCFKGR